MWAKDKSNIKLLQIKYIYYDENLVDNKYFEEYNKFEENNNVIKYNELLN